MTQLTVTMPDNLSALIIKVLKAFDQVKIEKKTKIQDTPLQDTPLSVEHKRILDGISEAVQEVNLHRQGKIKLQSGDEFIDELRKEGYL